MRKQQKPNMWYNIHAASFFLPSLKRYILLRLISQQFMDPLTILFAYFLIWIDTLNYTLGAAVIALAFVYFTRTLPVVQRIAAPAITGVIVSVIGTGILIPAYALPQLIYPLCLFALGSGCAVSYLAVVSRTKRNLGWVLIIVCSHLAAYCVMLSSAFIPLIGKSVFGFFAGAVFFSVSICCIAAWSLPHWNPAWTPWWISGNREGRNAFLRRLRRKKST